MSERLEMTANKNESNSTERSRSRLAIIPVFLMIVILAVLHIGNLQTGLKGYKGYVFFPTVNSATFFESPQNKELVLDLVKDEKDYLRWLLKERSKVANLTETKEPITVLYRAMAGLGHQLMRMSSAYHLLSIYQIPLLWPTENPVCGGSIFTIYNHLIGEGPILVDIPYLKPHNAYDKKFVLPTRFPQLEYVKETELSEEERKELIRTINLNNEVPSYSHPLSQEWADKDLPLLQQTNFYNKFQTDYQMYHQLMLLFEHKHKERIEEIREETRFDKHTVFALHIRTGNGETGDFQLKQREIANLDQWMESVMELFCDYQETNGSLFAKKPLMLYVGTDTGSVVPKLQNVSSTKCEIPIVSADQAYPEEGKSVSFLQKYDDHGKCLQGWVDMFLDMYFFTKANTVVTGSYSSFTQSAPLSFMMQKARRNSMLKNTHPHYFCEVGSLGNRMNCYQDMQDWILGTGAKLWGVMNAPEQKVRQELPFPNWKVKSIGIRKLFAKTLLREPEGSTQSSSSRLTFQEWMKLNENTSSLPKGIKGTQQGTNR